MNRSFLLIMLGAALWGTIGWFVKNLYYYGFTPMEVVTLRVTFTSIIMITYLLFTSPKTLKLIRFIDVRYFIGTGILSIIFFNFCMFTTIELSTIPIATALLYTAPAFVSILSYFLFKESFTKIKVIALGGTLIGSCLVVGIIPLDLNNIPTVSIIFGLGSGLGYALYSIFSKYALRKYNSMSITAFTFIVATVTLLPFFPYSEKLSLLFNIEVLFYAVGLGLFPTAIAYIVYTYGLKHTEASKASILSTIEPVVATIIGIFVFHEAFTIIQMIGMALIISAVILMQYKKKESIPRKMAVND
ncbi:DMT family transporter [Ornithinibacillus halotolerans]|uniref:EamA family transporter n=1 Tax=Ornithinibacillus halotolerans TaxID=1274357 RepID=A0A916S799_9BACI|nr:EamA family transporter [Ornithinibacillus halotolerans]GGA87796.1 EamA family transporter [Ornithinibacillus halotolerans]